jgi:hypothetical protein
MALPDIARAVLAIRLSKEDLHGYEGKLRRGPRPYIDDARVLLGVMRAESIVEIAQSSSDTSGLLMPARTAQDPGQQGGYR